MKKALALLILTLLLFTAACSTQKDTAKTGDISDDVDAIGTEINEISSEDGFDEIDDQFNVTIE